MFIIPGSPILLFFHFTLPALVSISETISFAMESSSLAVSSSGVVITMDVDQSSGPLIFKGYMLPLLIIGTWCDSMLKVNIV